MSWNLKDAKPAPAFDMVRERVVGSRKEMFPKSSRSVDIVTLGRESFSSLSSSRRTVAWISWNLGGMIT